MYLVTHIVTFSESPKVTDIPFEPRLAASEMGGSESYNMSDEVHQEV